MKKEAKKMFFCFISIIEELLMFSMLFFPPEYSGAIDKLLAVLRGIGLFYILYNRWVTFSNQLIIVPFPEIEKKEKL